MSKFIRQLAIVRASSPRQLVNIPGVTLFTDDGAAAAAEGQRGQEAIFLLPPRQ